MEYQSLPRMKEIVFIFLEEISICENTLHDGMIKSQPSIPTM